MSRIIVNEGSGPRPVALSVPRLVVGGTPDCEVRLRHPSAGGCGFVLEATPTGHRVVRLRGELFLNEEPCEVADLLHNDTLRAGEVMILYKNPAATRPGPEPAGPAAPAAAPAPAAASEPLEELAVEEEPELLAIEELDAPLEDAVPHELPPVLEEGETAAEPLEESELPSESLPAVPERAAQVFAPMAPSAWPPAAEPEPVAVPEPAALEEPAEFVPLEEEPVATAPPAPPMPAPVRAAPAGPVRFVRPLPPGCKAPSGPPPAHPGRPPR